MWRHGPRIEVCDAAPQMMSVLEFASLLIGLILISGLLARFLFSVVTVSGSSMEPTLRPNDQILVFRYWPTALMRRGQIIVFTKPHNLPRTRVALLEDLARKGKTVVASTKPASSPLRIKRVVGGPGDHVRTHALRHRHKDGGVGDIEGNGSTYVLPPGHFFVLGDGKYSIDSGSWGAIPLGRFVGLYLCKLATPDV